MICIQGMLGRRYGFERDKKPAHGIVVGGFMRGESLLLVLEDPRGNLHQRYVLELKNEDDAHAREVHDLAFGL